MSKIVAVHKEGQTIDAYKTDDNRVLSVQDAVLEADAGLLDGVVAFDTRDGSRSVRSVRGQENYSLSDLPEFK